MAGRLTVEQMLHQQIVAVFPLVHEDATVPAADDDLLLVWPVRLVRQVETCRGELGWGENPWRLLPLERLLPCLVRGKLEVLGSLCWRAKRRQPQQSPLSNLWHDN